MSGCSEELFCRLLPTTSVEFILSIVYALEQPVALADADHVERDAPGTLAIEDSIVGVVDLCPRSRTNAYCSFGRFLFAGTNRVGMVPETETETVLEFATASIPIAVTCTLYVPDFV
jgi:hypothetical protein